MLPISSACKRIMNEDSRFIKGRVKMYFAAEPLILEDDDIVSFSIEEETSSSIDNPIGNVTANTCNLSLRNEERQFDPGNTKGPYYGKLVPNIKFEVFYLVEITKDSFEEVKAGTFYTGDWDAPLSSTDVSVTGHDRLIFVINKDCPNLVMDKNVTSIDLYRKLFISAGLESTEFQIDNALDVLIPISWMPKIKIGEALEYLTEATFGAVYVNKNNKVVARSLRTTSSVAVASFNDNNQLFDINNPQKFLSTFTGVSIKVATPAIKRKQQIASFTDLFVPYGDLKIENVATQKPVAYIDHISLVGGDATRLAGLEIKNGLMDITLRNNGEKQEYIELNVIGGVIETSDSYLEMNNEGGYDEKKLTIDNIYIQNKTIATNLAGNLMKIIKDPAPYFYLSTRGNVGVELLDVIEIESAINNIPKTKVVITKIAMDFDGSLSSEIEARKIIF